MKHNLLVSLAFVMAAITSFAQTGVITVHHPDGSDDDFYYMPGTTLNNVLALVGTDDIIYLPGGIIPYTNMVLNTRVTMVGAGFHQGGVPVTQKTVIPNVTFGFDIGTDANGSSFHGIDFGSGVHLASGVQNVSFERCEFDVAVGLDQVGSNDPVGIVFKQCILRWGISGGSTTGLMVDNCVLEGGVSFNAGASGNFIRHCLFLDADLSGGFAPSITYTDNIFLFANSNPTISNPGQFFNNVFATPNGNTPATSQGVYTANLPANSSTLFPAGTSLTTYDYSDTYEPLPGTVPVIMASYDGTDAGIYGGLTGSPWKPMAIPYNPHWEHLVVPPATTGGVLQGVQIQGSAQSN